ncbi:hypothetical protein L596_008065 [Steinernema carpocapsae]|uniref:Uncharacterized protein n=1 Tax=Steinernema carpocapsae TaxID=34508 RepID=A0A4U5PBU6_STECR|nr:hypothetical protein L596_008065 [Steinernema carpocapsae]
MDYTRQQVASFISPSTKLGGALYGFVDPGEAILRALDTLVARREIYDTTDGCAFIRQFISTIFANREIDLVTVSVQTQAGKVAYDQIYQLVGPNSSAFKAMCADRQIFFEFFTAFCDHVKSIDVDFPRSEGSIAVELMIEFTLYFFSTDEKVLFNHPVIGGAYGRQAQANRSSIFAAGDSFFDKPKSGPPPALYDGDSGIQSSAFVNYFQCMVHNLSSVRRWPTIIQVFILRFVIKQFYVFLLARTSNSYDQRNKMKVLNDPPMVIEMLDFCENLFERWPMDFTFRTVMDTWVTFTRPWRYSIQYGTVPGVEVSVFRSFIERSRSVILYPIQTLAHRLQNADLCNVHVAISLSYLFELLEKANMANAFDILGYEINATKDALKKQAAAGVIAVKRRDTFFQMKSDAMGWWRWFYDDTIAERQKLRDALGYYSKIVGCDVPVAPPENFEDSLLDSFLGTSQNLEPDHRVDTSTGIKTLTPLGRKQVILGQRRFNFSEAVKTRPRILNPPQWYESETAARLTYRLCEFLNTLSMTKKLAAAYGQWTIVGIMSFLVMEPPYPRKNIPAFSSNIGRRDASPNIRFMASYPFLLFCLCFVVRFLSLFLF